MANVFILWYSQTLDISFSSVSFLVLVSNIKLNWTKPVDSVVVCSCWNGEQGNVAQALQPMDSSKYSLTSVLLDRLVCMARGNKLAWINRLTFPSRKAVVWLFWFLFFLHSLNGELGQGKDFSWCTAEGSSKVFAPGNTLLLRTKPFFNQKRARAVWGTADLAAVCQVFWGLLESPNDWRLDWLGNALEQSPNGVLLLWVINAH